MATGLAAAAAFASPAWPRPTDALAVEVARSGHGGRPSHVGAPTPRPSVGLGAAGAAVAAAALGALARSRRSYKSRAHPASVRPRLAAVRRRALSFYKENGNLTTFTSPDGEGEFEMDTSKVLGVGAQGKVYLGRHTGTGEEVAIKAMPVKHLILDEAGAAKMRLIDEEMKVLKSIGKHPNIAACVAGFDIFRVGTTSYPASKVLVMEVVKGQELAEHITLNGPLKENVAKYVFREILAGLSHMHGQGVIHRDLKLQNILVTGDTITTDSEVKLIDFGVAKDAGGDFFKTLVGTLEIMPPEMAKAKITYLPDASERKLHTAKFQSPQEADPGFGFTQLTPEGFGARMTDVDPEGQAGKQGVQNDWVLTKINDINVEEMLFQANPDDITHSKMPKIVVTLMSLDTDFTLEMMEMPQRKFSAKVDLWAVGVVLYTCLAGKAPFQSEMEIIEGDYARGPVASCSAEAKALLDALLEKNPDKRLSLEECLAHPWVRGAK